jgi:hypothetical protein
MQFGAPTEGADSSTLYSSERRTKMERILGRTVVSYR